MAKSKKMNPYECYQKYVALKLHFGSDNYDYFRAGGRTKVSVTSFEKRRDRYFFEKLSEKYSTKNAEEFLLANLLVDEGMWIGDSFNDQATKNFSLWKKIVQGLNYYFKEDISNLSTKGSLQEVLLPKNGHPIILKSLLTNEIRIESFIILNEVNEFFVKVDSRLSRDVVWKDTKKKCVKYRQFIVDKIDLPSAKKVVEESFNLLTSHPI